MQGRKLKVFVRVFVKDSNDADITKCILVSKCLKPQNQIPMSLINGTSTSQNIPKIFTNFTLLKCGV